MKKTMLLLICVIGLTLLPFFIPHAGDYSGSDNQAQQAIAQLAPNYKPWFAPVFEPASSEIESLLFTLQGSIGSAIVFYILGYYRESEQPMLIIDQFAYQSRWRHRDPRAKFGLYLLLMIVALTSSPMIQCFELLGTGVLTCHLLRISVARYLRWMLVPLVFLLVGLVGILISVSTQSDNMLWHIQLGSLAIGIDKVGLYTAHMTLWRSLATLAATYLFVLTTPFTQMIRLLQMSRLPKVLIEQMLLTYRFIFILLEEAAAIRKAQSLRFGYRNLRTSFQSLAMLIGMLLQRVIYRYQQMEIALEMKLFQGEFYS